MVDEELRDLTEESGQLRVLVADEKSLQEKVEVDDKRLAEDKLNLNKVVTKLEVVAEKNIEGMANTIGTGNGRLNDQLLAAGFNLEGHSFEKYCEDLVAHQETEFQGDGAI